MIRPMNSERSKRKIRKTRLKKKKRDRVYFKEREEKLFPPIVKIRKDRKKGKGKNSSKREL